MQETEHLSKEDSRITTMQHILNIDQPYRSTSKVSRKISKWLKLIEFLIFFNALSNYLSNLRRDQKVFQGKKVNYSNLYGSALNGVYKVQ